MRQHKKIREYTPRQCQIITLIATGHSNKEIALHLGINIRTVQGHLAGVRRDIGCGSNDYELALWAYLVMDKTLLRGYPYPEKRAHETVYPEALPNTAWCAQCKGYLDRSLFHKNRTTSSRLDSICKMHRAIAKRQWLELLKKNPEKWAHLRDEQHRFYMNRKHYEASMKYEQPGNDASASSHVQRRTPVRARRTTSRGSRLDGAQYSRLA